VINKSHATVQDSTFAPHTHPPSSSVFLPLVFFSSPSPVSRPPLLDARKRWCVDPDLDLDLDLDLEQRATNAIDDALVGDAVVTVASRRASSSPDGCVTGCRPF